MKVKTAILTVLITGGIGVGAFYGARYYRNTHQTPVEVVSVASINAAEMDMWFSDEYNYGTVVARDSQTVQLDTSRELVEVYVKTGDTVKVGDKLLAYDTTLVQLQKEMEELAIELLQINLLSQQKQLVKLQKGITLADLQESDDDNTGEAGFLDDEDEGDDASDTSSDIVDDFISDNAGSGSDNTSNSGYGDPFSDFYDDDDTGSDISDNSGYDLTDLIDDDEDVTYEDQDTSASDSQDTDSSDISDSSDTSDSTDTTDISDSTDDTDAEDESDQTQESETEEDLTQEQTIASSEVDAVIESFFSTIGLLREQDLDSLKGEYIESALELFQDKLAEKSAAVTISPNMLGETSSVDIYQLTDTVADAADESLQEQLYQGYAWVLVYDFVYNLNKLKAMMPSDRTPESLSNEEIASMDSQLRRTVDAFYRYSRNMDSDAMKSMLGTLRDEFYTAFIADEITSDALLTRLVARCNSSQVIEEPETESEQTEKITEGADNFPDVGVDNTSTSDEPVDNSYEIFMMEMDIRDTKLRIREEELKLDEYERALEECTVLATVAGVVKDAGTVEGGGNSDAFIVIGGEKGLYLEGTITEISRFPTSADSFWGDSNANASNYPFYAYIDESDGLSEGAMCEFNFAGTTKQAGITIPAYFIRTDISGRYYVMIASRDHTLMKKYVKTGSTGWNGTEIKSGLADTDLIAFPYGYNVAEGWPVKEVDSLSGMDTYFG